MLNVICFIIGIVIGSTVIAFILSVYYENKNRKSYEELNEMHKTALNRKEHDNVKE